MRVEAIALVKNGYQQELGELFQETIQNKHNQNNEMDDGCVMCQVNKCWKFGKLNLIGNTVGGHLAESSSNPGMGFGKLKKVEYE